jgi:hypothetical protein
MPGAKGCRASVARAQGFHLLFETRRYALLKAGRVYGLSAHGAKHKVKRHKPLPVTYKKVLEFDGLLGADAPAMPAPSTKGQVVE